MMLGIIAAVLFLLTAAKFITKRLPFKRLDAFALKIHPVSGAALLAVAVIHGTLSLSLKNQRPAGIFIIGAALIVCAFTAVLSRTVLKKQGGIWRTVHRAASALVCIGLVVHIVLCALSFSAYQKAVASITYDDIAISRVADGTFEGEYDVGYIYAKVSVVVQAGEIKTINILEHRNERGKPAERVAEAVIEEQSLNVDAVSGATNSSSVIKKAIENALKKG